MALSLTSPAFSDGGDIPRRHTCDASDVSPPLRWSGVPAAARSLVLLVRDPDAPDPAAPTTTWVHWVLFDLPAHAGGLEEGAGGKPPPAGARHGVNDWQRTGYGGPCPPIGRHRYWFDLFAVDVVLGPDVAPTAPGVEDAMAGHILEHTRLEGRYVRPG